MGSLARLLAFSLLFGFLALGCSRELVVDDDNHGGKLESVDVNVFAKGKPTGRIVSVASGSTGTMAAGEEFTMNGQTFVAGSAGATLRIRDGKLVLTGAKQKQ